MRDRSPLQLSCPGRKFDRLFQRSCDAGGSLVEEITICAIALRPQRAKRRRSSRRSAQIAGRSSAGCSYLTEWRKIRFDHGCIDNVDTFANIWLMAKDRSTSSSRPDTGIVTVAERPSAVVTKGSINLRIETHTRQLIDDAAAVLGKTRTEFMIDSARKVAIDVLLDQRLFVLDPERYDAFVHALDNPPAPGPKLRSLLRRAPAWEK